MCNRLVYFPEAALALINNISDDLPHLKKYKHLDKI